MSISELTLKSKDDEPVRRFEVFTGSGRRRDWSDEQKAQIVAESYEPGVTVSAVARLHGLTSQQLFTWRRLARKTLDTLPELDKLPMFAPAVVVPPKNAGASKMQGSSAPRMATGDAAIVLEIDGATVRIASGADAATIAAVIQALRVQR
ncbi:IS66-like element accessory protein TnpA [Rhizobium sullae]|uniref:IS66-like element accessory protein TnpA n=1 Tax=Rhizobium sullae TaxID=50338 RepID=UPI000B359301|nr:transposase [Rhizobium sullae]